MGEDSIGVSQRDGWGIVSYNATLGFTVFLLAKIHCLVIVFHSIIYTVWKIRCNSVACYFPAARIASRVHHQLLFFFPRWLA